MPSANVEPAETSVLALDNVRLDLPVAGTGNRALSAFLDYLVVTAALVLFVVGVVVLSVATRLGAGWTFALLGIGFFLIDYGYFAGVEIASAGRSFGKWVVGLRVVTRQGGRPSASAFLVRNVVRTVDLLAGIPLMAFDPLSRRLGDHLAGTLVVLERGPASELVLRRVPQGWGGGEVALLESFLRRAPEMEGPRAEALARQLLDCIERDDPGFLAGLDHGWDSVERLRRAVLAPPPVTHAG